MKRIRPLSEREVEYFNHKISISASYNSNAIEGNTFTFDETKMLIEKGIILGPHSLRESEDIIGYKDAFDFLYDAAKRKLPISEEFIKKVHAYVLRGDQDAGQYRKIQNYIGSSTRIIFTPCPPNEIQQKMKLYVEEIENDRAQILSLIDQSHIDWVKLFHLLAKHHIIFENIHPFIDGNGRTGRLLLIYEMIAISLLPVDIRYEERDRYYAALRSYQDKEKYSTRAESKQKNWQNCLLKVNCIAWILVSIFLQIRVK